MTFAEKKTKKLTILVSSVSAVGHVNACSGALTPFLRRGHRVVFVVEEAYRGRLTALGFEEIVYQAPKVAEKANPGEALSQMLMDYQVFGGQSVVDKFRNMTEMFHNEQYFGDLAEADRTICRAIETLQPDLLWWDGGFLYPSVYYSGIPWVKNQSLTSICFLQSDRVPPSCSGNLEWILDFTFFNLFLFFFSGYSSDTDPKEVAAFNELRKSMIYSKRYNDFIEKTLGYERFPEDIGCPNSQVLTVYASPEELNFEYVRGLDRWFNLEVFNKGPSSDDRDQLKKFVPESFLNDTLGGKFSGKIVYLSMGSMCSYDLKLMGRFVSILGATSHKYIVSKGPRHKEFSLAENMWGDRYLPQTSILPHVDLVITHGGK